MNSHRKIFSNEKKKIYMQNQDLLVTFNTLTHKNKYLANIVINKYISDKQPIKSNKKNEHNIKIKNENAALKLYKQASQTDPLPTIY